MSPPDTTGGLCTNVVASELTEAVKLDDLTDLILGNLMLYPGMEQANSLTVTRTAVESGKEKY